MGINLAAVKDGLVVELIYTLCLDEGEELDSCEEHEAIQFIHGSSGLVQGFTNAVYGLKVGEEKDFVVPPELGYGEHDPDANVWVSLTAFPEGMNPEVGMDLRIDTGDDEVQEASIAEITDEEVLQEMSTLRISRRRLPWLIIALIGQLTAAFILSITSLGYVCS